jgi:hypothetical protein
MDGTGEHHVKQNKSSSKGQRSQVFLHMRKLDLQDKCAHKCVYVIAYIHIYKQIHRETEFDCISGYV